MQNRRIKPNVLKKINNNTHAPSDANGSYYINNLFLPWVKDMLINVDISIKTATSNTFLKTKIANNASSNPVPSTKSIVLNTIPLLPIANSAWWQDDSNGLVK